jgi:hypothetical protein
MPEIWVFEEAMRRYKQQFLVTNFLADIIDRLLRVSKGGLHVTLETRHDVAQPDRQGQPQGWSELYSYNPHLYFKVLFSLDYALSSGKLPSEDEYPDWSPAPTLPDSEPPASQSSQFTPMSADKFSLCVYQSPESAPFPVPLEHFEYEGCNLDNYSESGLFCQGHLSESLSGGAPGTAGNDCKCTDIAPFTTYTNSSDPWMPADRAEGGTETDNGQSVTDVLSFMLQYSCPAIG